MATLTSLMSQPVPVAVFSLVIVATVIFHFVVNAGQRPQDTRRLAALRGGSALVVLLFVIAYDRDAVNLYVVAVYLAENIASLAWDANRRRERSRAWQESDREVEEILAEIRHRRTTTTPS